MFDYYIDPESKKFEPWSKMVPKFEMDTDTPLQVQQVDLKFSSSSKYFLIKSHSYNLLALFLNYIIQHSDESNCLKLH